MSDVDLLAKYYSASLSVSEAGDLFVLLTLHKSSLSPLMISDGHRCKLFSVQTISIDSYVICGVLQMNNIFDVLLSNNNIVRYIKTQFVILFILLCVKHTPGWSRLENLEQSGN